MTKVNVGTPAPDTDRDSKSAPDSADPPIFIGGAGRSGTTLVRSVLNAHPRIAIGPELKITPRLMKLWAGVRELDPYLIDEFGLTSDEIDDAFAQLLRNLIQPARRRTGSPRLAEKTPNNVFVFPHLHQVFPRSPLIHVLRDGRDVVSSLLRQEWASPGDHNESPLTQSAEAAAKYWAKAARRGVHAEERFGANGRMMTIRYEQLVTDPELVIRKLCAFVGEEFHDSLLRFYEHEDPFYESTQRPISDASVGRWKEDLDEDQRNTVKDLAGELLVELGYADDLDW